MRSTYSWHTFSFTLAVAFPVAYLCLGHAKVCGAFPHVRHREYIRGSILQRLISSILSPRILARAHSETFRRRGSSSPLCASVTFEMCTQTVVCSTWICLDSASHHDHCNQGGNPLASEVGKSVWVGKKDVDVLGFKFSEERFGLSRETWIALCGVKMWN